VTADYYDATHECPGNRCTKRVPEDMLACKTHWFKVTAPTRAQVWHWYFADRHGPEHLAAIRQAIREMNQ